MRSKADYYFFLCGFKIFIMPVIYFCFAVFPERASVSKGDIIHLSELSSKFKIQLSEDKV